MSATSSRKRSSKPTLADIAEQVGVSIATVSKVVNGKSDVSKETRDRVQTAIEAVSYDGRASSSRSSKLIDLVFQRMGDPWSLQLLRGMQLCAREHKLSVVVTELGLDQRYPNDDWVDNIIEHHPVGAVMVFSDLKPKQAKRLISRSIPVILLDPSGEINQEAFSVQCDNWTGGLQATRHLIKLGHKRIAYISGNDGLLCSRARYDGYATALAEAGIPLDPSFYRQGHFWPDTGLQQTLELFKLNEPPTAIFAGNDQQAMGVYEAARQLGIRIPDDLSVIGFDDVPTSQFMTPPLTTIHQPLIEMAQQAAQLAIDIRNGKIDPLGDVPRRIILPTSLVVRESTAPPNS